MKFFVTGVGGQLGHDVMNELLKRGHEGVGSDIQENYSGVADGSAVTKAPYIALDITDKDAVEKVITEVNPDAVIHCAAWTAVDMAEDDDKVAKVRAINAGGTQNIADVCKKLDCKMTYISTDYVFDGQGTEPWKPDCKDYKPLNVYGQTKLEGELAVSQTLEKYFIVRIAWVFGLNGKNFIKTMLNVGKTHDTVRVVNDQIGTPTYTYDLARLLVDMNETEKYGYYHATNEGGYISWYDFTKEIYRQAGTNTGKCRSNTQELTSLARSEPVIDKNGRTNQEDSRTSQTEESTRDINLPNLGPNIHQKQTSNDSNATCAEQDASINLIEQATAERQPHQHYIRVNGHKKRYLSNIGTACCRINQSESQSHGSKVVAHNIKNQAHTAGHHHANADEDEPGAMKPLLFISHFSQPFIFPITYIG